MSEFENEEQGRWGKVFGNVKENIMPGQVEIEGTGYRRRTSDRRIEKYLDEHFEDYIEEFGLVRELELKIHEKKLDHCEEDLEEITEFQKDAQAELEDLKRKLNKIEEEI